MKSDNYYASMTFDSYQEQACQTDQVPAEGNSVVDPGEIDRKHLIPLLGLVGEVGNLLSEYKKTSQRRTNP